MSLTTIPRPRHPDAPQFRRHSEVILMHLRNGAGDATRPRRLLVPVDSDAQSAWGIKHAIHRHLEGEPIEVVVLHVGETLTQWQVLRFRTQQEIAQFQSERARVFIEAACQRLLAENIGCQGVFRQGNLVFSILDVAEELDCDEIVMPHPGHGISSLFSRNIAASLARRQTHIPVLSVDRDGIPV